MAFGNSNYFTISEHHRCPKSFIHMFHIVRSLHTIISSDDLFKKTKLWTGQTVTWTLLPGCLVNRKPGWHENGVVERNKAGSELMIVSLNAEGWFEGRFPRFGWLRQNERTGRWQAMQMYTVLWRSVPSGKGICLELSRHNSRDPHGHLSVCVSVFRRSQFQTAVIFENFIHPCTRSSIWMFLCLLFKGHVNRVQTQFTWPSRTSEPLCFCFSKFGSQFRDFGNDFWKFHTSMHTTVNLNVFVFVF